MQLEYLLAKYIMPLDYLIVNQVTKKNKSGKWAQPNAPESLSFFAKGYGGKSRRMKKCVDYLLHIHVAREVPPMLSAGVRGLLSPFACPERAALSKLHIFRRAI